MTWYGTSSTSNTYTYTYSPSTYSWSTTTAPVAYDCSGRTSWFAKVQEQQRMKEQERKRREDELMSAFDEVFNG